MERDEADEMSVAPLYLRSEACLQHEPQAYIQAHPDTPQRILTIELELERRGWLGYERLEAPAASAAELELVHTAEHVRSIERLADSGGGVIDVDTAVGETSYLAALHATGAACEMTRRLLSGERKLGFCGVRPPGHHAEPSRAMGFCLFNSVAIAAQLAIAELGVERVLVLDWDVHHGNGTAEAFRERDDVLYVSIHQGGIYPGTGALDDVGSGAGSGYTVNLPVPEGSDGALWLSLLQHVVVPVAEEFAPELILVSAGFDAHRDDPLAGCMLTSESFAEIARQTRDLALRLDAPLGAVLEGGYEPLATAESLCATLDALAGKGEARRVPRAPLLTSRAASLLRQHWRCLM